MRLHSLINRMRALDTGPNSCKNAKLSKIKNERTEDCYKAFLILIIQLRSFCCSQTMLPILPNGCRLQAVVHR